MTETIDLNELHTLLTDHLLARIKNGERIVTKKGAVIDVSVSPAVLNVARAFLKDNGVESKDDDDSAGVRELAEQVRALAKDEDADQSRLN